MAYRSFKPYTPGRRQMTVSTFEEITATTPEKSLLAPVHSHGGQWTASAWMCRRDSLWLFWAATVPAK